MGGYRAWQGSEPVTSPPASFNQLQTTGLEPVSQLQGALNATYVVDEFSKSLGACHDGLVCHGQPAMGDNEAIAPRLLSCSLITAAKTH